MRGRRAVATAVVAGAFLFPGCGDDEPAGPGGGPPPDLSGMYTLQGIAAIDVRYRSRVDEVLAFPLDDRSSVAVVDLRLATRLLGALVQAKVGNLFQNSYVDVQERSPGATRSFRLTVTPRF